MLGAHGSAQKLENLRQGNHLHTRGLPVMGQQVPRKRLGGFWLGSWSAQLSGVVGDPTWLWYANAEHSRGQWCWAPVFGWAGLQGRGRGRG